MHNLIMLYQYTMGIPIDMVTNLLVSCVVKQVPFAIHVPLALIECGVVAYVLASQHGLCASLVAVAAARPCPVARMPTTRYVVHACRHK